MATDSDKRLGKRATKKAEEALEVFHRQTHCRVCDRPKDSITFKGETTYYCPDCHSFGFYCSVAGTYWRRNGEQEQN